MTKLLTYIICIFLIIKNIYINSTVDILQQTAADDEKLHINKKKIATAKEKNTFALE